MSAKRRWPSLNSWQNRDSLVSGLLMSRAPHKSSPRAKSSSTGTSGQTAVTPGPPIPWDAISQLRGPSSERYQGLIAGLVRANQAFESGDDPLYVILKCVVSVLHFLDADVAIAGSGLTRPLGTLAASLRDLGQGARPPLFFDRPKREVGRPKDISFEAAR